MKENMMKKLAPAILAAAIGISAPSGGAFADRAEAEADALLRVGSTGIMCVRAPCPWKGVVAVAEERSGPDESTLLWSGDDLPSLTASDADAERVHAAWAEATCVLVRGAFSTREAAPHLTVSEVIGDC